MYVLVVSTWVFVQWGTGIILEYNEEAILTDIIEKDLGFHGIDVTQTVTDMSKEKFTEEAILVNFYLEEITMSWAEL